MSVTAFPVLARILTDQKMQTMPMNAGRAASTQVMKKHLTRKMSQPIIEIGMERSPHLPVVLGYLHHTRGVGSRKHDELVLLSLLPWTLRLPTHRLLPEGASL
jgi:hypothetical protein